MTTCVAKKLTCYLRNTCAVSALEYAVLVGIAVVVIFAAYENFRGKIREVVIVIQWLLNGG